MHMVLNILGTYNFTQRPFYYVSAYEFVYKPTNVVCGKETNIKSAFFSGGVVQWLKHLLVMKTQACFHTCKW